MAVKFFRSDKLGWLNFKPLNLFQREILIEYYNNLSEACKFSSLDSVLMDEDNLDSYLISLIFRIYDIDVEFLEVGEVDKILNEAILPVNFPKMYGDRKDIKDIKESSEPSNKPFSIANTIAQIWGLCDSSAEALLLIKELPAEVLLDTVEARSKDLERMRPKTVESMKAEGKKKAKEDLLKRYKEKQNNANKQS